MLFVFWGRDCSFGFWGLSFFSGVGGDSSRSFGVGIVFFGICIKEVV